MRHRPLQALVAVMTRTQKKGRNSSLESTVQLSIWLTLPRKRPCGFHLILPVDANRVMHGGSAKPIPVTLRADIFKSSRINQEGVALALQADAERISMPVASILRTQCARRHNQLRLRRT